MAEEVIDGAERGHPQRKWGAHACPRQTRTHSRDQHSVMKPSTEGFYQAWEEASLAQYGANTSGRTTTFVRR